MKKYLLIIILLVTCTLINAQKPETVYSVAKVKKSYNWYVEQARLWSLETRNTPTNEEAWFNYFKACRMAKISFSNPADWTTDNWKANKDYLLDGDEILPLMDKNIPESFTTNYCKWNNHGSNPEKLIFLENAYKIAPNRPEVFDGFVVYFETQGNINKRKEFNQKWFELNDISPGLLSYNYNVLQSVKPGSIILTGGDNDTFPTWMIQDVKEIKTDVEVINISLLNIKEYRELRFKKLGIPELYFDASSGATTANNREILHHILKNKPKDRNIYLSMAIWKGYYSDFEENIYVVGNLLKFSKTKIDNIQLLQKNFDNYVLDYLKFNAYNDISKELVEQLNVNYLPGLIQLYNFYKETGNSDAAQKWKNTGLLITRNVGEKWKTVANESFK